MAKRKSLTDSVSLVGNNMDKRHVRRTKVVQNLYAWSFANDFSSMPDPEDERTKQIIEHIVEIDELINKHSEKFSTDKIAKTDLSILRLGVYELTIEKKLPPKVVIDEAVELAKELGGEKSYAFVNAVLGKVLQDIETNNG